jgi:hypothetical protein
VTGRERGREREREREGERERRERERARKRASEHIYLLQNIYIYYRSCIFTNRI